MNALQACHRAHWAWIRTQPQLVIPGVLDEPEQRSALLGFVEPAGFAAPHRRLPAGGLTNGATEPRHDACAGLTAVDMPSRGLVPLVAAPARPGASVASLQSDGGGRRTIPGSRGHRQKGA